MRGARRPAVDAPRPGACWSAAGRLVSAGSVPHPTAARITSSCRKPAALASEFRYRDDVAIGPSARHIGVRPHLFRTDLVHDRSPARPQLAPRARPILDRHDLGHLPRIATEFGDDLVLVAFLLVVLALAGMILAGQ